MKKCLVVLVLFMIAATFALQAQRVYKPFRFDIGMGASIPMDDAGMGFLFAIEPKYSIIEKVSVGFRMELNMMFQGDLQYGYYGDDVYLEPDEFKIKVNSSYLLTGDYHFTKGTFRPFVGLGVGLFQLAGGEVDGMTTDDPIGYFGAKTNFGGMARAGFDLPHFRFALEYNLAGKNHGTRYDYFAITVAGYFGGGKIK